MSANKRLRGVSVFRPIIYGNTAIIINPEDRGESDHTHRWTIAVRSATSPATLKKSPADTIGGGDDLR
jgi:YEATS domain-containing protein 4